MEQSRLHIRLDFAPLNAAVSLTVLTSSSPVTQTYDSSTGEYEPNRQLTPTVIYPVITATATDGSLGTVGNESIVISETQWYLDGVEIQSVWTEGVDYKIIESGEYKGGITIYKNVDALQEHVLYLVTAITDTRLNVNSTLVTDSIILSTLATSDETQYTLCIEDDTAIRYNTFYDRLFAYEYRVSHGYESETTSGREQATDKRSYLRTIPVKLYQGRGLYGGDYTVRLFEVTGLVNGVLQTEEITITDDDDNEWGEISPEQLVVDLRMVDKRDYLLVTYVDGEEVASIQFGIVRSISAYRATGVNGASRKTGDTTRYNKAIVISNGRELEYPESVIRLLWKTDSQYQTGVEHGEGAEVEYSIASTGAGSTYEDGWFEEYIESEHKGIHEVATDEDGNVFEDEEGNTLIFN